VPDSPCSVVPRLANRFHILRRVQENREATLEVVVGGDVVENRPVQLQRSVGQILRHVNGFVAESRKSAFSNSNTRFSTVNSAIFARQEFGDSFAQLQPVQMRANGLILDVDFFPEASLANVSAYDRVQLGKDVWKRLPAA